MQQVRRSEERGKADHGWLKSMHTFSFGSYQDPRFAGFGPLLVINEDRVAPGQGFGRHGHRDMEIISYVLSGALEHKDSMGNGSVLQYGDVQRMSAGRGVEHSEFNHSPTEEVHFLQIWITPNIKTIAPGYQELYVAPAEKQGRLRLIASGQEQADALLIHQDSAIYAGIFTGGEGASHALAEGRLGYVHLIRGTAVVNGTALAGGDALMLSATPAITIEQGQEAELLLFDLPGAAT